MIKLTLYYSFDDIYQEGPESIHIKCKKFPYTVLVPSSKSLSVKDIYDKYRPEALKKAAYDYMSDLGDVISRS